MSERTREPDRTVPERARKSSGGSGQTTGKKRPQQSQRPVERGEAGKRPKTATEKRRSSQVRSADTTVKKKKPVSAENSKRSPRKRPVSASYQKAGKAPERNRRTPERSRMDDDSRMSSRELERARRREERLRRVRRQKIIMAASATVIVLCLLTILIFFLSPAKCIISLSKGDKYARNEEYDKALEAYQEAIEINEKSVRAYRGAAGCLRMQEQTAEAEQLLYTGWEKTKDEGILRYYNKLLINEAVTDINAGNCTQTTVDKLNRVLMNDPENLDALALLDTCKQRMGREEQ